MELRWNTSSRSLCNSEANASWGHVFYTYIHTINETWKKLNPLGTAVLTTIIVHDLYTTISTSETFFPDFLVILKNLVQGYYKILRTCILCTTCVVICLVCSDLQSHTKCVNYIETANLHQLILIQEKISTNVII